MTSRGQQREPRRWLLVFLAAVVSVLTVVGLVGTASAASPGSTSAIAETRVGGSDLARQVCVGASDRIGPGQRLREAVAGPGIVVATGVAAKALPTLPKALSGGAAGTYVYFGANNGKNVYVGITNNLARRQGEHGARFALDPITSAPVTRGQARAIEQALIVRNPGFQNVRNSVSPSHAYYEDAVSWGESWLKQNGF